jgi:signal transduction histidine kinase
MKTLPLTNRRAERVRLSGRALNLARSAWLLTAVTATLTFLCALPSRWFALTSPPAETLANLAALGLAPTLYAAYTLFWELVIVAPWVFTGFVIFRRCGDQPMALFTALVLVLFGVGSGTLSPTLRTLLGLHPGLDRLLQSFEFLAWYGFTLFFYLFPDGRFVPSWTRWLALLWLPPYLAWNYAATTPLAPLNWPPYLAIPLVGGIWVSLAASQIYRYWRVSTAAERQQTRWIALAAVLIIFLMIVTIVIGAFVPGYNPTTELQATPEALAYLLLQWPLALLVALLPITIGVAIMRHRLWGIDRLISRTLVYGALTAFVALAYVLLVGGLGALLQSSGNLVIALVVTGLITVAFNPLRLRLERLVNRLLYGERDDPYSVLARLGRRLDATLTPEAILPTIVETIRQTLRLPAVAVVLREGDQDRVAASSGVVDGEPLVLPLTYQHALIGELHVLSRAPDEPFGADERRLLATIADQVGIVAHNVRLTGDLQRSREQIVTAREEERRRLRRDLHDGLGPRLAGQTLKLEAAREALDDDAATTRALLDEMLGESQALIAEIRRLVYGLRPPALDQLGLLTAIREQAAQLQCDGLAITIAAPERLPPLPAAVEVAAYRIVQEALTNVARHAHARRCTVTIAADEALVMTVVDDGIGLPEALRSGVGLSSMRERAEEIGGSCLVERGAQGGTHVTVRLPLVREGGR